MRKGLFKYLTSAFSLYFLSIVAGGRRSHPLVSATQRLGNPSYKKHHPRTASCCLRVGRQPPRSQCPQSEAPHSAKRGTWVSWIPPLAEEPGVPRPGPGCRSGRGCCRGAGGC